MALGGFFSRLKEGLARSTQKLTEGIATVFQKRRLDDAALEELEELLIAADLGTEAATRVIAAFRRSRRSMRWSRSTNAQPSRSPKTRPTLLLPAPIKPTSANPRVANSLPGGRRIPSPVALSGP